jgi:hypothetical protein
MFLRTQAHGREGAKALLAILSDFEQPAPVRLLAGEGAAQLGTKDDVARVKAIQEDSLEDVEIREKCKAIVARLGDRKEFNKELARLDGQLKDLLEKLHPAEEMMKSLDAKRRELVAVQSRTPEQEEELKGLQKESEAAHRHFVNLIAELGSRNCAKAGKYQDVREHAPTEAHYKTAIKWWNRAAPYFEHHEPFRRQMNNVYYNLACTQSLQQKVDDALRSLEWSFKWGFNDLDWVATDGDLANLRKTKPFIALLEEVKSGAAKERWKREAKEAPLSR